MESHKLDTIAVVLLGVVGGLISEGLPWLLMYRGATFSQAKAEYERVTRWLQKEKDYIAKGPKKDGKLKIQEEIQQRKGKQLQWMRMKGNFLSVVVFVIFIPVIYGMYDGVVVAKLPFQPILMVRTLAHQTLGGEDYTDCSMMFLYMLSAMFFKNNLQRLMGTTPPAGLPTGGMFSPPSTAS